VTPQALQVFYRDESQGILLGAVKTSNGWVYEIVDGDKDSEGRTTGDVAFHLSATTEKNTVYLLYDSVLTVNTNRDATSGEVRLAVRRTMFPEDWRYQTVDGPVNGKVIAGFATSIINDRGKILASWMVSSGDSLFLPSSIAFTRVDGMNTLKRIEPGYAGLPANLLAIYSSGIFFGCQNRLCYHPFKDGKVKLASGLTGFQSSSAILTAPGSILIAVIWKRQLSLLNV